MTRKEYLKKKHEFLLDCMRQTAMKRFGTERVPESTEEMWKTAFLLGALEYHFDSEFTRILKEFATNAMELDNIEKQERPHHERLDPRSRERA